MARLSVIIITLNEEQNLPALLVSIRDVADEVIVVDSGSTDSTLEIARAAGARVVQNPWPGFREQKAFALSLATGDYVLNLDADEVLEPELARAIRSEMDRPGGPAYAAYRIHFRHQCFGRAIRFGQMWRDRRVRLVRREGARYGGSCMHAKLTHEGPVFDLPGRCSHDGFHTLEEARSNMARDAEQIARERFYSGGHFKLWDCLRWPAGFLRRYVLKLGFLDGRAGLKLALLYAHYDADKARWLTRLEREIGGARGRGPIATLLRSFLRRLAVAIAQLIWPTPRGPMPPLVDIRKVLVVRTDERIGNQLLTVPLARSLKLGLPWAQVHLLAAARQSAVVASPHINRVIPFEKRLAFRKPWKLLAILRSLRRERYDVVVEAGHWSGFSLTASLLARLSNAPVIVGHLRGDSYRFLSHSVMHDPNNSREVQAKLELLRPFGLTPRGVELETELGKETSTAESLLESLGVGASKEFALLAPGARMVNRRGDPKSYSAVARGLMERGLSVLVTWGPTEEPLARTIAMSSGAVLVPQTDLETLAAIMRLARLCVSSNSGPMHLAVAVGAPTVGVFLSDDAQRWGHSLPNFVAAELKSDQDAFSILSACDRILETSRETVSARRSL